MFALRWLAEQILEESDEEDPELKPPEAVACGRSSEAPSWEGPSPQRCTPSVASQPSRLREEADDGGGGGASRRRRLRDALSQDLVDKHFLADLVWPGVPQGGGRREAWQMLLGYRPLSKERRSASLRRKRHEYANLRRDIYDAAVPVANAGTRKSLGSSWVFLCESGEAAGIEQIRKDLPRTRLCGSSPGSALAGLQALADDPRLQSLMERVLLVWSVRHPAAGYVQGLNDVLLPILFVFLADRAGAELGGGRLGVAALESLGETELDNIEADCYWCLSKLLSEVADHYTEGQPGLQRAAVLLRSLVARSDEALALHLDEEGLDINVIALRWLGCLMVRDLPMPCCARLWDTCIAESSSTDHGSRFAGFLVHFCAVFLLAHSKDLLDAPFDELMAFVQQPPTEDLGEGELEALISEAYVLRSASESPLQPWPRAASAECADEWASSLTSSASAPSLCSTPPWSSPTSEADEDDSGEDDFERRRTERRFPGDFILI